MNAIIYTTNTGSTERYAKLHGGNRVSIDNLSSVLDWYRTRK